MSSVSPPDEVALQRLDEYCQFVLGSLTRADQRRWGEAYVRGLLYCDGRRSIKRIAAQVAGCSDQSLQQFINQSPWDPQPVRQRLTAAVTHWLRPMAWVLEEVAFAKHGRQSAAIERQFVPSQGRMRNCQLGAVLMLASDTAAVTVNWRLAIPRSWDTDVDRRTGAHIPDDQRHQPYWCYQLEMLDDLSGDWGVPLAPVVVDARHSKSPDRLIAELDSRGLDYLVQVSGDVPVRHRVGPRDAAPPARLRMLDGWPARAGQRQPVERLTVAWRPPDLTHSVRSQFATVPARILAPADRTGNGARPVPVERSLLVEWRLGGSTPRGYWLTNMTDRPVGELATLAKIPPRARYDLDDLAGTCGLGHHEGRSFGGWHHHVTLVSVAQAFLVLDALCDPEEPIVPEHTRRTYICW